jgi:hypothetical protein
LAATSRAAEAITDADPRSQKAELESWNDVFGEPFQKMKLQKRETKKRETVARHFRFADQIYEKAEQLRRDKRYAIGFKLFDEVGSNLNIDGQKFSVSAGLTSDLYYYRKERLRQGVWSIGSPHKQSKRKGSTRREPYC